MALLFIAVFTYLMFSLEIEEDVRSFLDRQDR